MQTVSKADLPKRWSWKRKADISRISSRPALCSWCHLICRRLRSEARCPLNAAILQILASSSWTSNHAVMIMMVTCTATSHAHKLHSLPCTAHPRVGCISNVCWDVAYTRVASGTIWDPWERDCRRFPTTQGWVHFCSLCNIISWGFSTVIKVHDLATVISKIKSPK